MQLKYGNKLTINGATLANAIARDSLLRAILGAACHTRSASGNAWCARPQRNSDKQTATRADKIVAGYLPKSLRTAHTNAGLRYGCVSESTRAPACFETTPVLARSLGLHKNRRHAAIKDNTMLDDQ